MKSVFVSVVWTHLDIQHQRVSVTPDIFVEQKSHTLDVTGHCVHLAYIFPCLVLHVNHTEQLLGVPFTDEGTWLNTLVNVTLRLRQAASCLSRPPVQCSSVSSFPPALAYRQGEQRLDKMSGFCRAYYPRSSFSRGLKLN